MKTVSHRSCEWVNGSLRNWTASRPIWKLCLKKLVRGSSPAGAPPEAEKGGGGAPSSPLRMHSAPPVLQVDGSASSGCNFVSLFRDVVTSPTRASTFVLQRIQVQIPLQARSFVSDTCHSPFRAWIDNGTWISGFIVLSDNYIMLALIYMDPYYH